MSASAIARARRARVTKGFAPGPGGALMVLPGVLMSLLAGCAGLPVTTPQSTLTDEARATDWTAPATTGDAAAVSADAPEAQWWASFGDAGLERLVALGLEANQELDIAEARIRRAAAAIRAARAGALPQLGSELSASRAELSSQGAGVANQLAGAGLISDVNNFFNLGAQFDWEVDVFGRVGALVRAAEGEFAAAAAARQGVALSVAAAIAATYLDLRARQAQLDVELQNVRISEEQLEIAEGRFAGGLSPELDVLRARSQLDAARARLPGLRARIAADIHALGVLTGGPPETLLASLSSPGELPAPPDVLPAGVRSQVLTRRPDVIAAAWQVESAAARVESAVKARFPQLMLTGAGGTDAASFANLFDAKSLTWLLGAAVSAPLYQGGRIRAGVEDAEAALDIAVLDYDRTALRALEEAETALAAFIEAKRERDRLLAARRSSAEAASVALRLYDTGLGDYLTVLDAQREDRNVALSLVQARSRVNQRAVDLYRAIGGGWPALPAPADGATAAASASVTHDQHHAAHQHQRAGDARRTDLAVRVAEQSEVIDEH